MTDQLRLVDEKRAKPYVWPSWVTKLLSGEARCLYAAWHKAHHKYRKRPDDPDRAAFFAEYQETHDRIVAARAAALRAEGWTVKVEDEGAFKIRGTAGDLAGTPDIVAMRGDEALVVDAKAGKPRQSDHWQVLLYVVFLPMAWLRGFGRVRGEVEYRDGVVDVRPPAHSEKRRMTEVLNAVMAAEWPQPVPSVRECQYCDVAACEARAEATPEGTSGGMF